MRCRTYISLAAFVFLGVNASAATAPKTTPKPTEKAGIPAKPGAPAKPAANAPATKESSAPAAPARNAAAAKDASAAAKPGAPAAREADAAPVDVDLRAKAVLDKMAKRYEGITTVAGEFDQVKESEVFREKTESKGEFWHVKPNKFRTDYAKPLESWNIIVDNIAYTVSPKMKQVEKFVFDNDQQVRAHVQKLLLGFGVTTDETLKTFAVEYLEKEAKDGVEALKFTPRTRDESGIDTITVWVGAKDGEPRRLLLEEGEDKTTITIKKLKLNEKIDADRFNPKFDKDWDIIDNI